MYGSSGMGNVCVGDDAVTNQCSVSSESERAAASPDFCSCASRADQAGGENRNQSQKSPNDLCFCRLVQTATDCTRAGRRLKSGLRLKR